MKYDDRIKYLISGYYGIKSMTNYDTRLYILKDIEKYIRDYVRDNKIEGIDYQKLALEIEDKNTLKTKLQDSLILLNEIKGPIELELLIKAKIREIKYNENHK